LEYRRFLLGDRGDVPVDHLSDASRLAIVDVPRLIRCIRDLSGVEEDKQGAADEQPAVFQVIACRTSKSDGGKRAFVQRMQEFWGEADGARAVRF
jgi:hypothetical protein